MNRHPVGWDVLTHGNLLVNVLQHLSTPDILRCSLVNKTWYKAANNQEIWKGSRGICL